MAYREHGMWEVVEVLRRAHRGEKLKAIVRSTGRSCNTVRRYLSAAGECDWRPGEGEPDESLAARVWARLRPGPSAADPSDTARLLLPQRSQIQRWLKGETDDGHPLRLTKVHDLLERLGVVVTYSSLYRFAVEHCGFGEKSSTVRVAEVAPGRTRGG